MNGPSRKRGAVFFAIVHADFKIESRIFPLNRKLCFLAISFLMVVSCAREPSRSSNGPPRDGYSIVLDVWPAEDQLGARYEVSVRLWGSTAVSFVKLLSQGDSLSVGDKALQYGLVNVAERERLEWGALDPSGMITVSGTYRGRSSTSDVQEFYLPTQAAHPYYPMPLLWDRVEAAGTRDTVYTEAFLDSALIRLHETPDWEPDRDVVVVQVKGAAHEGTVETTERASRTARWLEIRQRYESRRASLTSKEFERRYRDYLRYEAVVQQTYRYRRRIAKIRQDASTATAAAARILGSDGGGAGSPGRLRRKAARDLLTRALRARAPSARDYVLLSQAALAESRYHVADSLSAIARTMDPSDLDALRLQVDLGDQLWDRSGRLEALRELLKVDSSSTVLHDLISHLYRMGRDSEAESLAALHRIKEPSLARARVDGYVAGFRCPEAHAVFGRLRPDGSAEHVGTEVILCVTCGPLDRVVQILEPMIQEAPTTRLGNNLAWTYVLLGRHLDRADDLVAIQTMFTPDDPILRNTQGALELRKGNVALARRHFESAMTLDDRPLTQVGNRYFLGLCDWAEGKKTRALQIWKELIPAADEQWSAILHKTLQLADHGNPEAAIFSDSGKILAGE